MFADEAADTLFDQDRWPAAIGIAAVAATAVLATMAAARRRPQFTFQNRVVVITGGSRGFGLAMARRLVSEGADVVLLARSATELDRAVEELSGSTPGRTSTFVCDVRNENDVNDTVQRIVATHGRIDALVNNAGVISSMPFDHAQKDDFRESLATHFWGPLFMIRACLPHMRQRGGRILNVASIGGHLGVPHLAPYCVGKFALVGLSEAIAPELAKAGVLVTVASPGLMRTGSHRNVLVRGQHRAEAAWFSLASLTPLTAMSADRAAEQVIDAFRRGESSVMPGWQSRLATVAKALNPELVASLLTAAAHLLPDATNGREGNVGHRSADLPLAWDSALTKSRKDYFNQPAS